MKSLIFVLFSTYAMASSSLTLVNAMRSGDHIPTVAPFAAIGSFRVDAQFDNYDFTSADLVTIADSQVWIRLSGNVNSFYISLNAFGESVSIPTTITCTACRVRAQRNLGTSKYTIEVWDEMTGQYWSNQISIVDTAVKNIQGAQWAIGGIYVASPNANIGMVRMYSTTTGYGTTPPPQRYCASGCGDLFEFELEGNLTDQSGNGLTLSYPGFTPAYVTTQVLGPASVLSSSVPTTIKAGTGTYLNASSSFSNLDNPVINCSWITVSSNPAGQTGTWSNPTSCSTAVFTAPIYFGTFNLQLAVADATPTSVNTAVKIGSVITDSNETIQVSDARISQVLGPLIRYNANAWSWMDDRNKTALDYQIMMNKRCIVQPKAFAVSNGLSTAFTTIAGSVHSTDCTFTDGVAHTVDIVIDSTGTPDTFKWKVDGGSYTTGVAITGGSQTIASGVAVTWAATIGHTLSAEWKVKTVIGAFNDYWNVAGVGTVSTPADPHVGAGTVTGIGTSFQTDFCGGPGNTVPHVETSQISFWYVSPIYTSPQGYGRGVYPIASCDSQTQITLAGPLYTFRQNTMDQVGIQYSVVSTITENAWTQNNIPGCYYGSCDLAAYSMYYRSGVDTYLNFARVMAQRHWESPQIDQGMNYSMYITNRAGGYYTPEPRSVAVTGKIIWYFDTSANVWPGMNAIHSYNAYIFDPSRNMNIGEPRNTSYAASMEALFALYNPDTVVARPAAAAFLQLMTNGMLLTYLPSVAPKTWVFPTQSSFFSAGNGSIYATVVDGSPNVTLTGSTWADFNFATQSSQTVNTNGTSVSLTQGVDPAWAANPISPIWVDINSTYYQVVSVSVDGYTMTLATSAGVQTGVTMTILDQWLWFLNDKTITIVPGNSVPAVGDTTIYHVKSITNSTHLVLDRNYSSTGSPCTGGGCQKGISVGRSPGFGTQPFISGLMVGSMAHFVYPALFVNGYLTEALGIRQSIVDGISFLSSSAAYDSHNEYYLATNFMNCRNGFPDDECAGQGSRLVYGGEAIHAYVQAYKLLGTTDIKTAGDALVQQMWCKPTGGWTCAGFTPSGNYLVDIDNPGTPGAYMLDPYAPTTNKWVGFFFGYGYDIGWPAARNQSTVSGFGGIDVRGVVAITGNVQ